jgi:hypothetical protein
MVNNMLPFRLLAFYVGVQVNLVYVWSSCANVGAAPGGASDPDSDSRFVFASTRDRHSRDIMTLPIQKTQIND